jgi:hypothetical protein
MANSTPSLSERGQHTQSPGAGGGDDGQTKNNRGFIGQEAGGAEHQGAIRPCPAGTVINTEEYLPGQRPDGPKVIKDFDA